MVIVAAYPDFWVLVLSDFDASDDADNCENDEDDDEANPSLLACSSRGCNSLVRVL